MNRLHRKPVITAIFALAFATIFTAISPSQTFAATPPDSCFNITASGYIAAYYNNQGNNAANPACPKDVDIPSQIGGVTVVGITSSGLSGAFESKQLTSVTFPNTLTYLGGSRAFANNLLTTLTIPSSVTNFTADNAFANNQLTSAALPNSITSIPTRAFMNNMLTSIVIPDSVEAIGQSVFFDNDLMAIVIPSSVTSISPWAFAFNKLTLVTIEGTPTLESMVFANNDADYITTIGLPGSGGSATNTPQSEYLQNTASIVPVYMTNGTGGATSRIGMLDANGIFDGTAAQRFQWWDGRVINPSQLTVQYKDIDGNDIAPVTTEVGSGLKDYRMSTLRNVYGLWPEITNATATSYYYVDGTTVSKTAPIITGYTLTSSATQTMELDTGANTMTFVYKADSDSSSDGAGSADDTETPAAPNTGLRTSIVSNPVVTVSGLVLIGAIVIVLRRKFVR